MAFQSYLFTGSKEETRKETKALARTLGIDLATPSVDLYLITPQRKLISIDQVRELKNHLWQKPLDNQYKLTIIEEADLLTIEAQNALLKILEEPPKKAIIVLEASSLKKLLPTIASRVVSRHVAGKITDFRFEETIWFEKDLAKKLTALTDIENPILWLDQQMYAVHRLLIQSLISKKKPQIDLEMQTVILEKLAQAKEMIEANVNPRFALADLVLSLSAK